MIRVVILLIICALVCWGQDSQVRQKMEGAFIKAADWIVKDQEQNGAWARTFEGKKVGESMGLTCLSIYALAKAPEKIREKYKSAIEKGTGYLVSKQNDEGSFAEHPDALKSYVTSIAIMTLCAVDKERYKEQITKAQNFLRLMQVKQPGVYAGGLGYGQVEYKIEGGIPIKKVSDMADLSNTGFAVEAMLESELKKEDEFWKEVIKFVERCQNNSETNLDKDWLEILQQKGFKVGNDGGAYYAPNIDKVSNYGGVTEEADGKKVINSYGSMTYDAIKTYLYAGLDKEDPRVQAAVKWVRKNYTVDYHPGFPYEADIPAAKRKRNQGIFYFYMMMAKAFDAYGENPFVTDDGKKHNWPEEIAAKLISLQKPDGSWINEHPRWWESDPNLVTPYVMIVFDILFKHVK